MIELRFNLNVLRSAPRIGKGSIYCDIGEPLRLSFLLSDAMKERFGNCRYIVSMRQRGVEGTFRRELADMACDVPPSLVKQGVFLAEVTAINAETDKVCRTWICEGLRLRKVGDILDAEFEIAPDIETLAAQFKEYKDSTEARIATIIEAMEQLQQSDLQKQSQIASLIKAYNNPMG